MRSSRACVRTDEVNSKFDAGAGGHPVEFISGSCITDKLIDSLRWPGGRDNGKQQPQLFARKFADTTLPQLLQLKFLDE